MKTRIKAALEEAALTNKIEILFACESGSRAWGFPSPDSDYDVRFIYRRKAEDYLSVLTSKDQLSFPITDDLDLYGWDIRKVLHLMFKSNSTPFEWLQSPVIYQEHIDFREHLSQLFQEYFSARTQLLHYYGITKGALETMDSDRIKIKKMFYVLRPVLAVKWIMTKNEYPPMNITPLLTVAPASVRMKVEQLIREKSEKEESYWIEPDRELYDFVLSTMKEAEERVPALPKRDFDIRSLDKFFQKWIHL